MRLSFGPFKGEIPRADVTLLPQGYAATAQNTKLWSGALRPFRDIRRAATLAKTGTKRTLYRWGATKGGDAAGDISAVAGGTPVTVTSAGHGLTTGQRVFVAGTGIEDIDNQVFAVTVVNANSFTLTGSDTADTATAGYWVRQNGYFFHWLEDVDVSRGTVAGDSLERTYYTGDGAPKMTYSPIAITGGGASYPLNSYLLGIPAPELAITVTPGSGGGCDAANQITTAYVYTYVSGNGEEGPPSPPSALVTYCPGQTLDLSTMSTGPAGNYNITHKRIYRVPFGQANYQFVDEVAVASSTYSDTKGDDELAEPIPSMDPPWSAPPSGMHSIGFLSNGIGYGASKNELCISVAYMPHAWPDDYRLTTKYPIVGLGSYDTNIVVCTEGVPGLATGSDPATMTLVEFDDFLQSCVSKRGIVGLDGIGVVYPSPDGLVAVSAGGPALLTEAYFTPDEWRALKPETMHAYSHDGRYFFFTDTGGYIFDPKSEGAGFIRLSQNCTGGFKDLLTDTLYLIVSGFVVAWEAASTLLTYTWKSPLWRTARPMNFGFGQVFAESYNNLTVKVYGDGTLRHTQTVTSVRPFRLPAGFYSELWQVEVSGKDYVREVRIAESTDDLRAA